MAATSMIDATLQRYRAAYSGLPREVWVLALVLFVNRFGAMVLPFFTLYLTSRIDMSEAAAGQMISLWGIGSIIGAYSGGRIVDWVGAVRVQTIGMFLSVPGLLLIPLWDSPLGIGLSVLFLSIASEAVRPANATAIAKLTPPKDRMKAFALQRLAANLGFSFGPAIGGLLATISFNLLFIADAITTFIAACVLLGYFRMRRLKGEATSRSERAGQVSPIHDRQFVAFLGLLLLSSLVFFQFLSTYPLYLRDHYGLTKLQIGMLFAVNTLVIVVFEMLLIDYVRKWPIVRVIAWGSLLSCVGFGLLPYGTSLGFAVFAMMVLTVGEMLMMPLSVGYVANRCPAGSEGRYMGWLAVTFSLAFVLGPAFGSALYAIDPEIVWAACLVIGVVTFALFYLLPAEMVSDNSNLADKAESAEDAEVADERELATLG